MTVIRLFKTDAMKEAFLAGQRYALANPDSVKDIFEAGENHGSTWLNEATNYPGFVEFMNIRKRSSPGEFSDWMKRNEDRLSASVDAAKFEFMASESGKNQDGPKKLISLFAIEEAIRAVTDLSIDDLRYNRRRFAKIKRPRYFAYYLAYQHCPTSLSKIGKRWGKKDHATVVHAARTVGQNIGMYNTDMLILEALYRYLHLNGYNIKHYFEDYDKTITGGVIRHLTQRIDINL